MAASSLLTLLDDIATMMDDVAVLSKVAAKKTAGVLGDDLALNAEQVTGVSPAREIPIVRKVARGSFINKLIIIPAALLLSQFAPFLIIPLLFAGGSFLCYEGFHKVYEKLFHKNHKEEIKQIDEKTKVKGAIRTDFILSLEIIVIALGSVKDAEFMVRLVVLSVIGMGMVIGVYGLVALIVKIDDTGLWLQTKESSASRSLGRGMVKFAPVFMKFLGIAGTIAMFLVGGGIVAHVIEPLYNWYKNMNFMIGISIEGATGVIWGAVLAGLIMLVMKIKNKIKPPAQAA